MIDAYADKPTDQLAEYLPGTPFGEICQWVDPPETSKFFWKKGRLVVFGGPRNRFVQPGEKPPITTKQSLYRAESDGYMHDGSHFDTFLVPSPLVIPLLHYKFMPDFRDRNDAWISHQNGWNNSAEYKTYKEMGLHQKCFKNEHSIKINSAKDLAKHINLFSRLIRRQGLAGSIHLARRPEPE